MTDAELVRYMDGELNGEARAGLEARIEEQPEARVRLTALRQRSAGLAALVGELDSADAHVLRSAQEIRQRIRSPSARRPDWFLFAPAAVRAAAAFILLAVIGVAAVSPARAWVLDRVREVATALGLAASAPAGEAPGESPAGAQARAAVSTGFPVAVDTFEVHVLEATGELVIRQSAGESGLFEAENAPGANPVIGSRVLRLEGTPAPAAIYRLTLPAGVPAIRVSSNDRQSVTYPLPAPGDELRIELFPP